MSKFLKEVNSLFIELFNDSDLSINPSTSAKDIEGWNSLMHSQNYGYVHRVYEEIGACVGFEVELFLETNLEDDCEFIDGYHGGDTTYARILLTLVSGIKL